MKIRLGSIRRAAIAAVLLFGLVGAVQASPVAAEGGGYSAAARACQELQHSGGRPGRCGHDLRHPRSMRRLRGRRRAARRAAHVDPTWRGKELRSALPRWNGSGGSNRGMDPEGSVL